MEIIQETPDLSAYVSADEVIDHHHPVVGDVARHLVKGAADSYAYAQAAVADARARSGGCPVRRAWHRQDCRGNEPGVDAQFSLDGERPAWIPDLKSSEVDYSVRYAEPYGRSACPQGDSGPALPVADASHRTLSQGRQGRR